MNRDRASLTGAGLVDQLLEGREPANDTQAELNDLREDVAMDLSVLDERLDDLTAAVTALDGLADEPAGEPGHRSHYLEVGLAAALTALLLALIASFTVLVVTNHARLGTGNNGSLWIGQVVPAAPTPGPLPAIPNDLLVPSGACVPTACPAPA